MSKIDYGYDRSVLIQMTPAEIKNMLADFAVRYANSGDDFTVDELAETYFDVTFGVLAKTDPTRFVHNN